MYVTIQTRVFWDKRKRRWQFAVGFPVAPRLVRDRPRLLPLEAEKRKKEQKEEQECRHCTLATAETRLI